MTTPNEQPTPQMLSDDELGKIMEMACIGKPQSNEELWQVVKRMEEARFSSKMLAGVLSGKLCAYMENGQLMLRRADIVQHEQEETRNE